jgi:hypothetical protein
MTHVRRFRTTLAVAAAASVAAVCALLAPTTANATLVGMESAWQLVNTNQTNEQREAALDLMQQQGVQVVRVNWRWFEVAANCDGRTAAELADPTQSCYDWSRLDNLVSEANERRIQVLLSAQQNPSWLQHTENRMFMGTTAAQFNRTVEYFASFYKALATRYKPGSQYGTIRYFTVHNEPNSVLFWGGPPSAVRYAQLYAKTAVAIKQANPSALVAPGPTGPTGGGPDGIKPVQFVKTFQQNVVKYLPGGSIAAKKRYINAWAHNPYPSYTREPSFVDKRENSQNIRMSRLPQLVAQLDRAPITKGAKVWATEFGWQTPPERSLKVTQARQAQFVAEAYDLLSSMRGARVQIGIHYGLQDPDNLNDDWQSGTILNTGRRKLSFTMFQNMVSVPQGGTTGRVKANTRVRVWGRSNVHPGGTQLAYRIIGQRCQANVPAGRFCMVPAQRSVAGTPGAKFGYVVVRKGQRVDFAVYDKVAKRYGMTRRVVGQ